MHVFVFIFNDYSNIFETEIIQEEKNINLRLKKHYNNNNIVFIVKQQLKTYYDNIKNVNKLFLSLFASLVVFHFTQTINV